MRIGRGRCLFISEYVVRVIITIRHHIAGFDYCERVRWVMDGVGVVTIAVALFCVMWLKPVTAVQPPRFLFFVFFFTSHPLTFLVISTIPLKLILHKNPRHKNTGLQYYPFKLL